MFSEQVIQVEPVILHDLMLKLERELCAYWEITTDRPAPKTLRDMISELKSELIIKNYTQRG